MNLDDLLAVWRSQDAAPLHDMNKTLLHLVLRQEEAELQRARRRDRWITYAMMAFVIGLVVCFLVLMIHARQRYVMTGWDYVVGIGGAAAALLAGAAMYAGSRAQALREQRFGESLRDQIKRRIAQLDDQATGARRRDMLIAVLTVTVCPIVIFYVVARINDKTLTLPSIPFILSFGVVMWALRHARQRATSRKRELQALLKEIDDQ